MNEVKVRVLTVNVLLSGETGIVGPLVRESCFLQLRMICELIAFGCLIAHGDIKEAKKLRDEYSAGKIVNAIEKLHDRFYPLPVEKQKVRPGFWHMADAKKDFLTKADLVNLNGKCGDVLHRGTLKKLLAGKIPFQTNFPEITGYLTKIVNLLGQHAIVIKGDNSALYCIMDGGPSNDGQVQVVIANAVYPPDQSQASETIQAPKAQSEE